MLRKFTNLNLTVAKAKELDRKNIYEGRRGQKDAHSEELAKKILDNRWHEGVIAVLFDKADVLNLRQIELVMNGQHQCKGVCIAKKSAPCRLHLYTTEPGDTKEDIATVFAQYNVDLGRTRRDIACIYGVQYGMGKWPKKVVAVCNTALALVEFNKRTNEISPQATAALDKDTNARLLGKYKKACFFIYNLITRAEKYPRHLMRSPVVALAIQTWEINHGDALLFWQAVRDGDMLKQSDPAYKFREFLRGACVRSVSKESSAVTHREMYGRGSHWWNAYRGKDGKSGRYLPDKPLPKLR